MDTHIKIRRCKTMISRCKTILCLDVLERRFDARVGNALVKWLSTASKEGFDRVVLNLGAVEFMDSSGLGAVVSVWRKFHPEKEVSIEGVKPAVRDLLYMTRMDHILPISISAQDTGAEI